MGKTRTAFTIVFILLTLTITSQPAMSHGAENILVGAAMGAGFGQAIGHNTEATLIGGAVGALIGSQVGYYPSLQTAPPPRPRYYSRPVLMVPAPVFRPRPVVYVPQPRYYRNHRDKRHHRHHRKHWKRHGGRARW